MSTSVTWNGTSYTVPATGEEDWGGTTKVDGLLISLVNNGFQKTGGTFTLSADADFGASAGLKSIYYKSRATVSTAGVLRLGNTELAGWRNAGNTANHTLGLNGSDAFEWKADTTVILTLASTGSVTTIAPLLTSAGSASAPSHSFSADTNTGLYSIGADNIGVTTGGTLRFDVSTTAVTSTLPVVLPAGSAAAPSLAFASDLDTGIYQVGGNNIGFSTAGTARFDVSTVALTSTVPLLNSAGSAASPSISFASDTNTGLYSVGADNVGVSTGGTLRFDVSTTAVTSTLPVLFPDGSAAAPSVAHAGDTNCGLYFGTDIINFSTAGSLRGSISAAGLWTLGTSSGTEVHTVNGTLNILGGAVDAYSARFRSSTTTGGARIAVNNSDATRGFEFKGAFGAGTELLTIGSDSADLMYLNRAGTTISFPNISTTAVGGATATMTNAPAGASGNPDIWVNFTFGGTVYVIPAWTP